jgi:hypothetical protein
MANITAVEKGRNLEITVGDAGADDSLVFTVKPLPSSAGARLLSLWAGIAFAGTAQPEEDALDLGQTVIGDEWDKIDELRSAESTDVINAAFLWNVQGGGIELVNEMLRDGLPKAQATLASASGFAQDFSALTTLLSGGAGAAIPSPGDTSATSTPSGSDASSNEAPTNPPTTP